MVEYLGSVDIIVQRSAMRALEQLGKSPESCIIMHRGGVVKVKQICFMVSDSFLRFSLSLTLNYIFEKSRQLKL